VGLVVAGAVYAAGAAGVLTDKEYALRILFGVVIFQALAWFTFVVAAWIVRKSRKTIAVTDAEFRAGTYKLVHVLTTLGRSLARSDSLIFEYLFLYRLAGNASEVPALDIANTTISQILDQAARALKIITSDTCAIAIKSAILRTNSLQTLYRDSASSVSRGDVRDKVPERLSLNKPMDAIARNERPYYICVDLKAAALRGEYTNSRKDWKDHYNATIVHPIEIYAGQGKKETKALKAVTFLICIDNTTGGLSNDFAREIASYTANRISPLLYRAEILKILTRPGTDARPVS
jgi:hypothetical protein